MKKAVAHGLVLSLVFLAVTQGLTQESAKSPRSLKLLTVGNSLAGNAMFYFPQIVQSNGDTVQLFRATPGGCSLEKHARWAQAYEANPQDPEGRPYGADFYPARREMAGRKLSLREALESDTWDVVTIQQLSDDSYKPETFEPFAGTLVAYIHKYAPQARILAFQTWAFREDYAGFKKDDFTQEKMYDRLAHNYEKIAADYNLQVIPVGYAFQKARATERWHFKFPDPAFDYKNPVPDTLPQQAGSLNVGWGWWKSKEQPDKPPVLTLDQKHANEDGKYLAGLVFYEALFGRDVQGTSFVPEKIDPKDAAELRRIAHEAFASYPGRKVTQAAAAKP